MSDLEKDIERGDDAAFVMDKVDWYRQVLQTDPTSLLFLQLAEELSSRQEWAEVVETCRHGLTYHQNNLKGLSLLGTALWKLGQAEEAEHILMHVRYEFEQSILPYKSLAEIAESKGDTKGAKLLNEICEKIDRLGEPSSKFSKIDRYPLKRAQSDEKAPQVVLKEVLGASPAGLKGTELETEAIVAQRIKEVEPEDKRLPGFLTALMEQFEKKGASEVSNKPFLSDWDRSVLEELLRSGIIDLLSSSREQDPIH